MISKLDNYFFSRDVLEVAPELPGKYLVVVKDGKIIHFLITEVEAYRGEEDKACHASKGRTARTEILYHDGGHIYVYLIYGMYWMLNFVTGLIDEPQAVLIRGLEKLNGPGKLTRHLAIDRSFYGEDLGNSKRIWVEDRNINAKIKTSSRIGIYYAGEPWISKPWNYSLDL